MSIIYQEKKRLFSLQTKNSEYQMKVDELGFLQHLYYGAPVGGGRYELSFVGSRQGIFRESV